MAQVQPLVDAIAKVAKHERRNDFVVRPGEARSQLETALKAVLPDLLDELVLSLPTYADNAAALTGGLVAGQLYKTAGGAVNVVV